MIGERFTYAELTRTSSTPLQEPGSYHTIEKQDGSTVVAKYGQVAAATSLDTADSTKIAAGVGGYLMAPAGAYDDPYLNYMVTDHIDNSLVDFISGTGTAAPALVVGFAACDILAEYWGWFITWGLLADMPCDTSTNKFNDAGTLATVVDYATHGNRLTEATAPQYDSVVAFSTAAHGTAVVDAFITIGLRF